MAEDVKITVDARQANLKLDRITPAVRDRLRAVLPNIIRQLAALVGAKLDTELQSRKSLSVAQELHESVNHLYGVARLEAAPPSPKLLPQWLEEGTQSHFVAPVNASALHWVEDGEDFFSRGHWVRGIGPYLFMQRSLNEMEGAILIELKSAAKLAAKEAR